MTAIRLEHAGAAAATTITAGISDSDLTLTVADATGWPTGGVGPFIATIGAGTASEEKVKVTSRVGTTFTVASRGFDSTTAQSHLSGVAITHTFSATEADEANVAAVAVEGATGGLVGVTKTQTLTNKTLTSPVISAFGTASGLGAAAAAYTPTLGGTGWAIGDGTITAAYKQTGPRVDFRIRIVWGSTSTYGSASLTLTLPVTSDGGQYVFKGQALDTPAGTRFAVVPGSYGTTGTLVLLVVATATGQLGAFISTAPFTWASGDELTVTGSYFAA